MNRPTLVKLILVFAVVAALGGTLLYAQNTLPPGKEVIEQQYEQQQAAGQQNPAPRNPNAPYPIITETFDTGIFSDCDSVSGAIIVNCWRGIVNNNEVSVYAGSEPQDIDAQQGIVAVLTQTGNYVATPVHNGAVRIVAAQNGVLTLVTADNAYVLLFNVSTQSFTSISNVGGSPTGGNSCNGVFNGTFSGQLTVTNAQTCIFVAGGVNGNVSEAGGNLVLLGATITGNLAISGGTYTIGSSTVVTGNAEIQNIAPGSAPGQICGAQINGNIEFHNNSVGGELGGADSCSGNVIGGNLEVHNNSGTTAIFSNMVTGNLHDHNNTGATQVYANIISSILQCEGNTAITGGMNAAPQKQGQCSGF